MLKGKGHYLKQLTSQMRFKTAPLGRQMDGSTPPSVFIGSWNYPKVYAGPLLAPSHGDTTMLDTPEQWLPNHMATEDIIGFRLNLVRGKQQVNVTDVDAKDAQRLQEITLSKASLDSEAEFRKPPQGRSFDGRHTPHGPSAMIEDYRVGNGRWDRDLERAHYDTDLKAADAVVDLHGRGVEFSRIQKAFSVGSMGSGRKRRLVPTRWSITACDSILADRLLADVRHCDVLDCYRVYEYESLNNRYAVVLTPTPWQYEWMEAFLHVIGREELVFADHEGNRGKRGYSCVGGCYYSCKFGVLEALAEMRMQAGAIVLREAYGGYVPLGVFNVRENVRAAMGRKPSEHNSLGEALDAAVGNMSLPLSRFEQESTLLADVMRNRQTTLTSYT